VFSPGTIPIAMLDCTEPIVFWTDAIIDDMLNYYPGRYFSRVSARSKAIALRQEREALTRAGLCVYSSNWAADGARRHYGIEDRRLLVLPFGSNVSEDPTPEAVARMVEARPTDSCRLLFIGVEWARKGGPIAIEATRLLNERGIPTELTVIGAPDLQGATLPGFVRYLGFVSKNSPEGARRFTEELGRAHYLILPTQADASPIVLGEANSFGLPVLTTSAGGIADIVDEQRSGWLFDPNASADSYADAVAADFSDPIRYRAHAYSACEHYRRKLAWDGNARILVSRIGDAVAEARARRKPGRADGSHARQHATVAAGE
jgi:glycosyltransferase involved in cell wall biosynthesis